MRLRRNAVRGCTARLFGAAAAQLIGRRPAGGELLRTSLAARKGRGNLARHQKVDPMLDNFFDAGIFN